MSAVPRTGLAIRHTPGITPGITPGAGPSAASCRGSLVVRWSIGVGDEPGALILHATLDDRRCFVTARVAGPVPAGAPAVAGVSPIAARAIEDHDLGLLHIEAPGTLRATVDTSTGAVLFADTHLFARMGVRGGRYDIVEAAWTAHPR